MMKTLALQDMISIAVFGAVILIIAFNWLDMTIAALVGVMLLTVVGIMKHDIILSAVQTSDGALALLFGGMVVARTLRPTGLFEYVGNRFLLFTRGSGKRFLLGIIVLVVPLCAILPNATTVILLAPIIIGTARALNVDFVRPMVLTAILSNSAGLLTLIGDPATFLIGNSIGLTFMQYLERISLGGVLAVLTVVPLLPWLMKDIWHVRLTLSDDLPPTTIERPGLCILSLGTLALMVLLFLVGESLPTRIIPPAAAILGATLALTVVYCWKVEPIDRVLGDVDWKSIIFLFCMFSIVETVIRTGILQNLSLGMHGWFGGNLLPTGLFLLAGIGVVSAFLANIPVAAAMLFMTKSYLVVAELVPEEALGATFTAWPPNLLPVFAALMFGATLGGNATLVGASANVVAAGICAANGKQLSFIQFARCGIPITLCQLSLSALYVCLLFRFIGR